MGTSDSSAIINVLYVDDEPVLLNAGKLFLEHLDDISVTIAESASEALGMVEKNEYDAIISDYQMPDIDGLDFLRTVRGNDSDIPFIIFTGKSREEVVIEALNAGADFYLQKGGNPNTQFTELINMVRQAIRRRSAEKAGKISKERYHGLFTTMPIGVAIYQAVNNGDDFIFTDINPAAENIDQIKRDELIGKSLLEVFPGVKEFGLFEIFQRVWRTGNPEHFPVAYYSDERIEGWRDNYIFRLSSGELVAVYDDLTDQKQAELALEMSEEKYRGLFENAVLGIYQTTLDGFLVNANDAFARMYGYSDAKEFLDSGVNVGLDMYEHPEDRQKVIDTLKEDGILTPTELLAKRRDKSCFWILSTARPVKGRNGAVQYFEGICTDITEQKKAEEALRENEEKFRLIFNTQLNGVIIIDPDNHSICDINYAALSMLGAARNDVIGKVCHKFICTTEVGKCPITDLGRTIDHAERQMINSKGDSLSICKSVSHVPIGGKQYLVESFIDITGRKKTEEALLKSESLLKDAMDLAKLVNWEYDIATDTLTFDDRFYALYGTTREREGGTQMSSKRYAMEFVHPDDMHYVAEEVKKANEAATPGFLSNIEHRIIRRDGEIRNIVVRVRVEQDENGRNIKTYGANQDITDRKIAEDAVYEANKKLNILNSVTRHDIINQIVALNILLDLVKKKTTDKDTIENITYAESATSNIYRQIEFTKEYQDIGLEAPRWQNPTDLIAHANSQFEKYPYEIENNLDPVEIYADPLIEKVFYNLLDNAERHSEKAKKVSFTCRENGDNYILVCEDDGAGIDPEMKKTLFKRGHGKNTGYGLYLIREILSITGITIEETGEPGKGARFEMTVPKCSFRHT